MRYIATDRDSDRVHWSTMIAHVLLVGFVGICIFDPADVIFGSKVGLFLAFLGVALYSGLQARRTTHIPIDAIVYVLIFVTIPALSMLLYYLARGTEPYAGLVLIKGYLLVSLTLALIIVRADCIHILSIALTCLAGLTIVIFLVLQFRPDLFLPLYEIGSTYRFMSIFQRAYSKDLTIIQVTFATAPMLAVAIPHYFDRAASSTDAKYKALYLILAAVCCAGMFLAGLRNTMAVAVLLPFVLWPIYTKHVIRNYALSFAAIAVLALPFVRHVKAFLDPSEVSNSVKLTFLNDYAAIFNDPVTLMFGRGLGAYHLWSSSGLPDFETSGSNFYFITELTYLEMIRSFGLVGAVVMLLLLLYPVWWAFFVNTDLRNRALAIGFIAYLGMCITNPLLFSSLGILILTAILADMFKTDMPRQRAVGRSLS